jgi:hypothetical protein
MELIPILATIILIATIVTFILAIGAYILYKVRERKGVQKEAPQPAYIKAELLTPEMRQEQYQTPEQIHVPGQIIYEQPESPVYRPQAEPIFVQERVSAGRQPMQPKFTPPPQQFAPQTGSRKSEKKSQNTEEKMLKYTSEGYVPPKSDKSSGALKWR